MRPDSPKRAPYFFGGGGVIVEGLRTHIQTGPQQVRSREHQAERRHSGLGGHNEGSGRWSRVCPGGRGRKISVIQRQEVEGLRCHVEVLDFILQGAGEVRYDQLDLRECPGGSVGQGLGGERPGGQIGRACSGPDEG